MRKGLLLSIAVGAAFTATGCSLIGLGIGAYDRLVHEPGAFGRWSAQLFRDESHRALARLEARPPG